MSASTVSNRRHGHGPGLSPRERKVLRLLAHGKTVADIAAHLHRTEQEVQQHIDAVLSGYGVRGAAEALALAGPGPEEADTEQAVADEPAAADAAASEPTAEADRS